MPGMCQNTPCSSSFPHAPRRSPWPDLRRCPSAAPLQKLSDPAATFAIPKIVGQMLVKIRATCNTSAVSRTQFIRAVDPPPAIQRTSRLRRFDSSVLRIVRTAGDLGSSRKFANPKIVSHLLVEIGSTHHASTGYITLPKTSPESQPAVPARPPRLRRFVTIRTCRNVTDCIDFLTATGGSFWTTLGWQFAESRRTLSL